MSRKESSHLTETQRGQNEGVQAHSPNPSAGGVRASAPHLCSGAENNLCEAAASLAPFNTSCLSSSTEGGTPTFLLHLFPLAKVELVLSQAPSARPQGGMGVRKADAVSASIFDGTRKEEASRNIAARWRGLDFQSSCLHITPGAAQGSEETCSPHYCLHLKQPSCAVEVPLYFLVSW